MESLEREVESSLRAPPEPEPVSSSTATRRGGGSLHRALHRAHLHGVHPPVYGRVPLVFMRRREYI